MTWRKQLLVWNFAGKVPANHSLNRAFMNPRDQTASLRSQTAPTHGGFLWVHQDEQMKGPRCGPSSMLFNRRLAPWPGAGWCQPVLCRPVPWMAWRAACTKDHSQMSSGGQAAPASAPSSTHSPPSVPHFFHTPIFIEIKHHPAQLQH